MTAPSPMSDACPQCPPGDHPAVPPAVPVVEIGGSLKASYRHGACGTSWDCWWDPGAVGWPLSRDEAA